MAYRDVSPEQFLELAKSAAEIARILKKAAGVAEKSPDKSLHLELGTIEGRLVDIHKRTRKLEVDIDDCEKTIAAAAAVQTKLSPKKEKKG